ncbi:leukocyte elastase inhibitor isoform X2 [Anabrus simplex]|uniref:leukocyte elastase inhibitor isoform X2 n=1 Tax=Anabrus simplex TaxID=316456 RepID=UPI0035A3AC7D
MLIRMMETNEEETKERTIRALAEAHENFSIHLYKVFEERQGNVVFSPLVAELVLVLALMGAKGSTSREISTVLHLPQDSSLVLTSYQALLNSLKSCDLMTIEIVNKLFVPTHVTIKQEFQTTALNTFLTEALLVDFSKDAEQAARVINSRIQKKTQEKIKEVVSKGSLSADSGLVLVSALYLQGTWLWPFTVNCTTKKPFNVSKTTSRTVTMMSQVETFNYVDLKKLKTRVLRLPFNGKNISMLIFLPYEIDGIAKLEKKISQLNISAILKSMKNKEVELWLPRFKFEETIDLKDNLTKMGVTAMFSSTADFSNLMDHNSSLPVSHITQKVYLDVNEFGCDASAPSTPMAKFCCWSPPKAFHADHPFMFAFVDIPSSAVLYMGRLYDPGPSPL